MWPTASYCSASFIRLKQLKNYEFHGGKLWCTETFIWSLIILWLPLTVFGCSRPLEKTAFVSLMTSRESVGPYETSPKSSQIPVAPLLVVSFCSLLKKFLSFSVANRCKVMLCTFRFLLVYLVIESSKMLLSVKMNNYLIPKPSALGSLWLMKLIAFG